MQTYVWLLLNELHTCELQTPQAKEWQHNPSKAQVLEVISRSPTLVILEDIYVSLQPFQLQPNIKIIPTWKAFSFIHDVGYTIPIHTFLYMHNMITSSVTNINPNHLELVMRSQPLVKATLVNQLEPNEMDTVILNIGTMSGKDYHTKSSNNPT